MKDIETIEDIRYLVDTFYRYVRADEKLGPVFHTVIRNNWDIHLEKMYRFWQSLLFHEQVYSGNPLQKHLDLPVSPEHFARWIELFKQTVNESFSGDNATRALELAENISSVFQARLFSAFR